MLDRVAKYSSVISIGFLIAAVIYEFLYFESFGVDIFTYITFSEIITLFIGKIPLLLAVSFFVLTYLFLVLKTFEKSFSKLIPKKNLNREQGKKADSKIFLFTSIVAFIYMSLIFGPFVFNMQQLVWSTTYFYMRVVGYFLLLILISISFEFSVFSNYIKNKFLALFIILFYASIIFLWNYSLMKMKINPRKNDQIQITLKDNTIISTNDTLIYVGKTNNYIFLHNTSPKNFIPQTMVINMGDVKNLNIYKEVRWFRFP